MSADDLEKQRRKENRRENRLAEIRYTQRSINPIPAIKRKAVRVLPIGCTFAFFYAGTLPDLPTNQRVILFALGVAFAILTAWLFLSRRQRYSEGPPPSRDSPRR